MSSLLLRDLAGEIDRAVADKTSARPAALVAAVASVGSRFGSITAVNEQQEVDWTAIASDVATLVAATSRLRAALINADLLAMRVEVETQLGQLATTVAGSGDRDVETMLRTSAVSQAVATPTSLSSEDQAELFRQAIAGATAAIVRLRGTKLGTDRDAAIALSSPIPDHLHIATDAAMAITNREDRRKLTPDVEGVSSKLDDVAQMLSMAPRLKWASAFADMFDGENQLRKALGVPARARPYSGTIDPQAALDALKASADGTSRDTTDYTDVSAVDPQTAVNKIAVGIGHTFDKQLRAVTNLERDLQEPPPPKQPSLFDTVLDIAVSLALGGVAGAIGGAIADRLKRSLDRVAKGRASALSAEVARVTQAGSVIQRDLLRRKVMDKMLADTTIYRAAAVDGAKDAAKVLFRDSVKAALLTKKARGANSRQPLNSFIQQQQNVLSEAHLQAALKVVHLASALAQLDLDTLNELSRYILTDVATNAYAQQYDSSLREWLNFKAQLDAPGVKVHGPDPKPVRDVDLSAPAIAGVLEVRLVANRFQPTKQVTLVAMTLRGGEPAAKRHLRDNPRNLGKVGINAKYFLGFDPDVRGGDIELGVGPDLGLQVPLTLDLRLLKLIATGDLIYDFTVLDALIGGYDHVTPTAAMEAGRQIVKVVSVFDTSLVKE